MRKEKQKQEEKEESGRPSIKLEEIEFIETPTDIVKKAIEEYEDSIMTAYQKKGDGEWTRVEIPYKRKKKR